MDVGVEGDYQTAATAGMVTRGGGGGGGDTSGNPVIVMDIANGDNDYCSGDSVIELVYFEVVKDGVSIY